MPPEILDDTLRRVTASKPVTRALSQARSVARRFLVVTLALIGAFCGVLAVAFERYVEWARELLIGRALELHEPARTIFVVLTPTVVFTLIALAIRTLAPRAVGANLARVRMAYNEDPSLLSKRAVAATFAATPLSLGAGAPLGPEGPIVVVTSGFSAAVARLLQLPRRLVRGMIPVGVAAGIAAVFNTPITGVVFALEEVFGAADRGLLGGVLVGAVAAAVVEKALLGGRPLLAAPLSTWSDPRELIGFAAVGIISGLVSGVAIAGAHRLKRIWAAAMPSMLLRAALSGLLIGAAGLLSPSVLGVGYDSVSFWLHGGGSLRTTALAFGVKTLAFVVAISGGVLGGSFAPSLFIGTALGASIGHATHGFLPAVDPKAYAIVGMGAFFAGLLRSPIAAVLIAIELTRDYELVVPLMLAVSLAVAISRRLSRFSIVEQQMIDEGYVEEKGGRDPLANARATEVMTANPLAVPAAGRVADAVELARSTHYRMYPVVDPEGRMAGVVSRDAIEAAVRDGRLDLSVIEIMEQPKVVALASDALLGIVERMRLQGVNRCPVVDGPVSRRLVGFISPSDILRARLDSQQAAEEDTGFELFE